jgi:integrase
MPALTYSTLIGLLIATGLRPGEAIRQDRSDVDLVNGILAIRESKFGKSRFVPVDESTRAALERHAQGRDRLCSPSSELLFQLRKIFRSSNLKKTYNIKFDNIGF